jgi:AraC-like DNA-binding protein
MQAEPTVATALAHLAVAELQKKGSDVKRILEEAGLERRVVNNGDARIAFVSQAKLLEIAARESGDGCFGLHLGTTVSVKDFGALGYMGIASRTLGDALLNFERYLHVLTEAMTIEVSVVGDEARIFFNPVRPAFANFAQNMEASCAVMTAACRQLTNTRLAPKRMDFVHGRPKRLNEVKAVFGGPVRFDQPRICMVLERKNLALPIESTDQRLLKILAKHCDELLAQRARHKPELLQTVERRIVELLSSGRAKAKIVAEDLGMSERTFVRRLEEHNTSFSGIVEQLRHKLALKYVENSNISLTETAFLLGYATPSAFSSAFKRWTGHAPSELRA